MSKRKRACDGVTRLDVCDLVSFKCELQAAALEAKRFIFDKLEDVKRFIRPHAVPRVAVFDCVSFQLYSSYRYFLGTTDGILRRFVELIHPQRILHEYHNYEQVIRNDSFSQADTSKVIMYQEWLSVALRVVEDLLFFIVRIPGFLFLDLGVLHVLDEATLALLVACWQLEPCTPQFDCFRSPILTQFFHFRRAATEVKKKLPDRTLFTREFCLRSLCMLDDALGVLEVEQARLYLSRRLPPELVQMVVVQISKGRIPSVELPQVYRAWPKSWPALKHNCSVPLPLSYWRFRSCTRLVGWSYQLKQFVLLVSCCNRYLVCHWDPRKPAEEVTAAELGEEPLEPWQILWDIAGY